MLNKKMVLVIGVLIMVVSAARFITGRMFNRGIRPIYRDTTKPPSGKNETMQLTVGDGTLDYLNSLSVLTA